MSEIDAVVEVEDEAPVVEEAAPVAVAEVVVETPVAEAVEAIAPDVAHERIFNEVTGCFDAFTQSGELIA